MKYLLLIIRHLFPRRIWTDIDTTSVYTEESRRMGMPVRYETTQRDQFGNLRLFKH